MFKTLFLAGALSAGAMAAHAADLAQPVGAPRSSIAVPTGGVNFADREQVTALHQRLWREAFAVCANRPGFGAWAMVSDRICAREAVKAAVAAADQPLLTAVHKDEAPLNLLAAR